jgi:hypothetical protein
MAIADKALPGVCFYYVYFKLVVHIGFFPFLFANKARRWASKRLVGPIFI